MASGELIFVMKSGQSLRVPVANTDYETEKEFADYVHFWAEQVMVEGSTVVERDSSNDLVILPVDNIDYIRGRWT